jgi:hypothetical protein
VSGAFPTSSSFSRSAINLYAGAQTGWANVWRPGTGCWSRCCGCCPLLHHVPQAVLAAVVVLAVLGLVKPGALCALAHVACGGSHCGGHLWHHAADRAAHVLGRADRRAAGPGALSVRCGCTRASSKWACTPTAACATATCGSCRQSGPRSCALRMDAELDFAPPARWSAPSPSTWWTTPTPSHVCCLPSPSTALTPPAWKCSCQLRSNWLAGATSRCTSAASSCRWKPCCARRALEHGLARC